MAISEGKERLLIVVAALAGAASLGYELLWTRLLAVVFGSERLAVIGVLIGFFAGIAVGAFAFHHRVHASERPLRLFAILEALAAVFAISSVWWLTALAQVVPSWLGPSASDVGTANALTTSAWVSAAILLPGTVGIGATFPALVESAKRWRPDRAGGRTVGSLYAAYTLGATIGIFATVYLLLPGLGFSVGALVLGALGLLAAGLGVVLSRAPTVAATQAISEPIAVDCSRDPDREAVPQRWLLLFVIAATGLIGIGVEVIGVLVLSQILENTIYTFANVLAVFLVGTAVGSWLYSRLSWRAIAGRPATVLAALTLALAMCVLGLAATLTQAPSVLEMLAPRTSGFERHIAAELCVALLVFGPVTILMGALFAHVMGLVAPRGIGKAYACNALGSALAPMVYGLWAINALGYRDGLFALVYSYLALFAIFAWLQRFSKLLQLVPIMGIALTAVFGPESLVLVEHKEGWIVLDQRETSMGVVTVTEQADSSPPRRWLMVGQLFRMGGSVAHGERRMGHLTHLLHPRAKSALYLGVGTGATLGASAFFPLERIDGVEIIPAVIDMLQHFHDSNSRVLNDERTKLVAADARRFVAATPHSYDVIVADLFHPGRDGAARLYTREHFENVRSRLQPGGVFTQWLPLHQLDPQAFKSIVATFLAVFDDAHGFLGMYNVLTPSFALVGVVPDGKGNAFAIDIDALSGQLKHPEYRELRMPEPRDVLGAYMLDRAGLEALSRGSLLNEDRFPRVQYFASRLTYTTDVNRGWANLELLLAHRTSLPYELLEAADSNLANTIFEDANRFAQALALYLEGEYHRIAAGPNGGFPEAALNKYFAAYDVAPQFLASRSMLLFAASRSPADRKLILERMLARTPDDPRLGRLYRSHLRKLSRQPSSG